MTVHLAVVGALNVDLVVTLDRMPDRGEIATAHSLERHAGGKGLNQAAAAARLGAVTHLLGSVGEDEYGPWLRSVAHGVNVDTSLVADVPGPSGVAVIEVEPDGANRIASVHGANGMVSIEAITQAIADLPAVDMVLGQAELPLEVTQAAFAAARARGVRTLFNAAPAIDFSALYGLIDILVLNASAASHLTGLSTSTSVDADEAAQVFVDHGILRVVVTRGARGAVWRAPSGSGSVPSLPVRAIDTTGAEGAFCAGLAVGLAEGQPFAEALRLASAAAALSTTVAGAVGSMPTREAAEELLQLRG